jgi:hypothetical protein
MYMKKTFLASVIIATLLAGCDSKESGVSTDIVKNPETGATEFPEMKFDKMVYDFGTIDEGVKVAYSFTFTNTGKSDLVISNATTSCGCTASDWPRHPVKPGESEAIKIEFNSAGKSGQQDKMITLSTNCEKSSIVLSLRGIVNPKKTN